jgi:uncharacterized protein (DUF779 family)
MLRFVRVNSGTITNGVETLVNALSASKNKKYKIISISTDPLANMYLRVYKNSEQICDIASIACTSAKPFIDMDIDVELGDLIKVGFYNNGAATTAKDITIGYKEL